MNVVTHYRLMKKISEIVYSVHYERKAVLVRVLWTCSRKVNLNPLTSNDPYRDRTAPLTS